MVFDPTSLITGALGLFGKNKDEKNTRANMHVQQGMTLRQMRLARNWQNQDTRRMAQQANKARRQSLLDQSTYFGKTRRYAEKAGFNPFSVVGMLPQGQTSQGGTGGAMGSPGGPSPVMSSANADAFMMMGNAFGETINQAGENQALRAQNEQMNETIKNLTVRPKIDGIYAQREATPSYASAMGYQDENPVDAGQGGSRPVLGYGATSGAGGDDPLRFFGRDIPTDNNFSDAQKQSDRYGDLVESIGGMFKLANDTGKFISRNYDPGGKYLKYIGTPFADAVQGAFGRAKAYTPSKYRGQRKTYTPMGYSVPYYD